MGPLCSKLPRWIAALLGAAASGWSLAGAGGASRPIAWRLDNLRDIGGHAAEVVGTPRVTPEGAVRFDGVGDGLILPASPLAGLGAFTIEALIRPDADGAPEQRFFHTEDERGNRATLEIRLTADGRWALDTFLLSGNHHLTLLDRSRRHPAGRWTWVALRYNGRSMTAFVDGAEELTGPVAISPFTSVGRTAVGVRLNRVYWFKGEIRELRFHDRALGAAELQRMP